MTPAPAQTPTWSIIEGDVMDRIADIETESVQTCVTSPPYWGLRDYNHDDQLGLEATPEEYTEKVVTVFREVRRVLRDDGTLWLNLGDSYAAGGHGGGGSYMAERKDAAWQHRNKRTGFKGAPEGLKPKDLVGIPWRVAFALQQPYYAGIIAQETNRAWLAAIIDGEGSIGVNKLRARADGDKTNSRVRDSFGPSVRVHNTSERLVRRCAELTGVGSVKSNDNRRRRVYVWAVYGDNARTVLREVYPYLVAKQHEARLAFGSRDDGEASYAGLKLLHHGRETTSDAPDPPSCLEPGWYLRSDIIWAKPNPMPESVTDRPTKSHEYLFLLSKSKQYYYNAEAIKDQSVYDGPQKSQPRGDFGGKGGATKGLEPFRAVTTTRNKRTVWTIPTQPFPGAHFAVFPTALVEPCVLAGSKPDDLVLDPFAGSGTVGVVCRKHARRFVGIEINPEYAAMARGRLGGYSPTDEPADGTPGLWSAA